VRKGTKSFISILSLGIVAAGYQAGQAAEISSGFSAAAPVAGGTSAITAGSSSAGSETLNTPAAASSPAAGTASAGSASASSSAPATTTAPATTKVPASTPSSSPKATTAAPAPVSTPKATVAPVPAAPVPAPASSSSTKTGSAISYRYGTVQVSVTKTNGKITAVNLLQQGATGGRQQAFPALVQAAVSAQGSGFGNMSGATYTVDAFKQSLESALAKF
jgi:uncharacterized protein with FMN-binding domain